MEKCKECGVVMQQVPETHLTFYCPKCGSGGNVRKADDDLVALAAERNAAISRANRAVALLREMWEQAEGWAGPTASSHYRSEIHERLQRIENTVPPYSGPGRGSGVDEEVNYIHERLRELRECKERLRLLDKVGAAEFSRVLAEKDARIAELERLAYIGEHQFPDATYKVRLEEAVADLRKAENQRDDYAEQARMANEQYLRERDLHGKPVWYEVVEVQEDVTVRKLPHGMSLRGPIEKIMVVVLDVHALQTSPDRIDAIAKRLLDQARTVLKEAGWDGEVIMISSDTKLARLQRLPDACAMCGASEGEHTDRGTHKFLAPRSDLVSAKRATFTPEEIEEAYESLREEEAKRRR